MPMRASIVEDERDLARALKRALTEDAYASGPAHDATSGFDEADSHEARGGAIAAESGVDEGSTVTMTLPAAGERGG